MVRNYVIGIGYVGTKLISKAVEVSGGAYRIEHTSWGKKRYAERAVDDVEFQIIDMGVIDKKTEEVLNMLKGYNFADSDQIYILKLEEGEYRDEAIITSAKLEYENLLRYYDMFVSPIMQYLGPGKGVQRYRPLAKYFITRSKVFQELVNIFNSDIDEDIFNEGHNNEQIRLIAVLSAGGGFGSGSLHYILTLLTTLLRNRNINYYTRTIINIPTGNIGYSPRIEDLAPVDGLEGTKAAAAALLLELLYLHTQRPGREDQEDYLLKMGFTNARLNPELAKISGVDDIVLTTFTNIAGRDITSIYDIHDEEVGRFLYSEVRRELGPLRENIMTHYGEYMNYIANIAIQDRFKDFAIELLVPVTVIGVASIKMDPDKVQKLLNDIVNKSSNLESHKEILKNLKSTMDELIEQKAKLQSKLNALEEGFSKVKLDSLRKDIGLRAKLDEIDRAIRYISNLTGELNRRIDNLINVENFARAESEVDHLTRFYNDLINSTLLENRIDDIENAIRRCGDLLSRSKLSIDDIAELGRNIVLLENSLDVLQRTRRQLEEFISRVNNYRNRIEPGLLDKILNRDKCRTYGRLSNLYGLVTNGINRLQRILDIYTSGLKEIRDLYEAQLNNIKTEIESTRKSLEVLEDEMKKREKYVDSLVSQIRKLEDELKNDYENASKELLSELQKYHSSILREIDLEKFVKGLKGILERAKVDRVGISTVISAIRDVNPRLAEEIVSSIINYMRGLRFFATLSPESNEHLASILGLNVGILNNCLMEHKYIITSPDNNELAQNLVRMMGGEMDTITVERAKMSFIAYIKRRVVVPLQVKEVRDCLKAFFENVDRRVIVKDKTETLKEYRGLAYMTLDISDPKLKEYLEKVRNTLVEFEKKLEEIKRVTK